MTSYLKARILILPKKGLRDPQGETISKALSRIHPNNSLLHVAKGSLIELSFDKSTPKQDAQKHVQKICEDLLVNPLIEQHHIEWFEEPSKS